METGTRVQLIGSTLHETIQALKPRAAGSTSVDGVTTMGEKETSGGEDRVKAIGRLAVTMVLLGIGSYFVTSQEQQQRTLGTSLLSGVAGYWLK